MGCGLRKIIITRSTKTPNHDILGAQHLAYMKQKVFPVTQRQKLVACDTWAPLEHSPGTFGLTGTLVIRLESGFQLSVKSNQVLKNISA